MGFPDRKEMQRALKKLEKAEGTLALSPKASPLKGFVGNYLKCSLPIK